MSNPEASARSALAELSDDPASRRRFLKQMGGGLAGASALSLFLAACGGSDDESSAGTTTAAGDTGAATTGAAASGGDLEIVNYALTLEYIEADFYAAVIKSGVVTTKAVAEAAKMIHHNEEEHVVALLATAKKLGTPAKKPKTTFQAVIDGGEKKVLETAATVENLGAAAYLGQAGRIESKEILAAALAIHTVEARHAAALNKIVGKSIVPDGAFAKPASMEEVLPQVKPFLAS